MRDDEAEATINGMKHVARIEQFGQAAYVSVWDGRDYRDVKLDTRDARVDMAAVVAGTSTLGLEAKRVLFVAARIFQMGGEA